MDQAENSRLALVTGATGFVGINLVHALLKKGCKVACLVRSTSDTRTLQNLPVRLIEGDLNNPAAIAGLGPKIHVVYHAAGVIKAANRNQYFQINQAGTRNLLEKIAATSPELKRFVCISSLAASGPSVDGCGRTEEQKAAPISWYGESKLAEEAEALRFADKFPVTILRPSAVYGPYDREILLIFRMIKRGCLITPGRHARKFSLVHVSDLVDAIMKAGEAGIPSGEIFHISRPEIYLWEDVGRAIAQELGKSFRRLSLPSWMAVSAGHAGDCWTAFTGRAATINSQKVKELMEPFWLCNSSKAQKYLGFHPEVDLKNGIRETVHWYQNQGWL